MTSPYQRTAREWINFCDEHITAGPASSINSYSFPGQSIRRARHICNLLDLKSDNHVVDIGCGNGRVPVGFAMDGFHVRYTGIEIIKGCVDFCKKAFADVTEFDFHHIDICNPRYNPNGTIDPKEVIYPVDDGCADFMLFGSVFTHIVEVEAVSCMLDEARRILNDHGICYCTWFLSPPNEASTEPVRVVHSEEVYRELISDWHLVGEHKGNTTRFNDQRLTILQKLTDNQ